jgi:CO/xanthine dehydrogenase Mo-binding subunit
MVGNKNGDVEAAISSAATTIEAVYAYPYQNHATLEPQNATALYTAEKCVDHASKAWQSPCRKPMQSNPDAGRTISYFRFAISD